MCYNTTQRENMLSFKDILYESFNSKLNINKVEEKGDLTFYYINVNNKNYKIFIERVDEDLHLGFERELNVSWIIDDLTNDLSTEEVLGLLGTMRYILVDIIKLNFNSLTVFTNDIRKNQMYFNIFRKLNKDNIFKQSRDDSSIMLYKDYTKTKFKYKK